VPWSWSACWWTALKVKSRAAAQAAELVAVLLLADAVLLLAGLGSSLLVTDAVVGDVLVATAVVEVTFFEGCDDKLHKDKN